MRHVCLYMERHSTNADADARFCDMVCRKLATVAGITMQTEDESDYFSNSSFLDLYPRPPIAFEEEFRAYDVGQLATELESLRKHQGLKDQAHDMRQQELMQHMAHQSQVS